MTKFKDHFSHSSNHYQKYRPTYPDELFAYLSSLCSENRYAWDVGTGNGQAALKLSNYFEEVLATDASANQIEHATAHPKVNYHVSKAEHCPAENNSFDLITVAQAFHWFDFDQFFKEVKRVSKEQAVVAIWTYTLSRVEPEIDAIVEHFYREIVGKYWPIERDHVESLYENITFPFESLEVPEFHIELEYDRYDLLEYLGTWSAVKNYKLEHNSNPLELIQKDMKEVWPNTTEKKKITWPIHLKVGRP